MRNERTVQDRHETPVGVRYNSDSVDADGSRRYDGSLVDNRPLWGPHHIPDTELEAIMVCAPGETPRVSFEELEPEKLEQALACLTEKELAVIELVVFGGMSLAVAGGWLGAEYGRRPYSKQAVSNIRDGALAKLREHYENL